MKLLSMSTTKDVSVFFFTYRGIDNYSGFLWVPQDGQPEKFERC